MKSFKLIHIELSDWNGLFIDIFHIETGSFDGTLFGLFISRNKLEIDFLFIHFILLKPF